MSELDVELRERIAGEHGLDAEAAEFLVGTTVEELEQSATALAELVGERHEQEAPDFFAAAAAAKAERKRALVDLVTGRTQPQRDEQGRYTGFDGGARQSLPAKPESHEQWLVKVLRSRRADAGARF
jgi:hypothetical protein